MRKIIALLFFFLASMAHAQNGICPTAANGDSSNKCASTQFVQNAFSGGSTLNVPANVTGTITSGGIPYFNTTSQMSSSGALASGNLVVGGGASGPSTVSLGGDCTFLSPNVTCTKTNGVSFGTAATQNTGTSGATIPLLNGNNTYSGSANFTGTFQINAHTITWPSVATTVAALNIADQTVSGGANVTSQSLTTGSITVDCGSRPLQFITNGGAFTITAPASDGSCILLVTNNGTAGAITFSGFSVGSNTGDPLTTTNTNKFMIQIIRINSISTYAVKALQ